MSKHLIRVEWQKSWVFDCVLIHINISGREIAYFERYLSSNLEPGQRDTLWDFDRRFHRAHCCLIGLTFELDCCIETTSGYYIAYYKTALLSNASSIHCYITSPLPSMTSSYINLNNKCDSTETITKQNIFFARKIFALLFWQTFCVSWNLATLKPNFFIAQAKHNEKETSEKVNCIWWSDSIWLRLEIKWL